MRTIERANRLSPDQEPPRGSRRNDVVLLVIGLALIPVLALMAVSQVGAIAAIVLACFAGLGLFVARKGFLFVEMVAFLIHFDGIGLGPIRAGRILAAVAFGVLFWKLFVDKWRPPAVPTRHWLPPLALTTLAVLSGVWSPELGSWLFGLGLMGLALAIYSVTALMVDSHDKIMRYLRAYWIGGMFGAATGVVSLFMGGRSEGFGGDPNFFGLLQASMIPLTVYYRRHARSPREKLLYTLALVYVIAGAAGAGSRSGVIGATLVLVATMVTKPKLSTGRRVRTFFTAALVGGMLGLVLFFINPANTARGLNDRGGGRLDFWAVAFDLIGDRPVFGYGFGQLRVLIPPNLATTPGVERVSDIREEVSSHNTWIDIAGDIGVVGLIIWTSIFVITMLGFLRPRWSQTKEISTTLAVMMVPVLSGSFLLPLLNNKLAWSLIGLAAALQVPSRRARWRGYQSSSPEVLPARLDDVVEPATAAAPEQGQWESPDLARWDLRISRRFRMSVVGGALAGAIVLVSIAGSIPARYTATAGIVMPALEQSIGRNEVVVSLGQVQTVHTLVTSGAYAQKLQELAGLDLTVPEIRSRVDVNRPEFAAYMELQFTDRDRAVADQVLPYLVPALDAIVAEGRALAADQVADEVRPVIPGEQRYYTGPMYFPVSDQAFVIELPTPTFWFLIIGAATGAMVALGFVLYQQRNPRVNNDDDLHDAIGMDVWAHVARLGRRYAATRDQFEQVVTATGDHAGAESVPRRIVVSTPKPDRIARGLAMGVAAAVASEGRRVVLVDAQSDRPMMSWRLAPFVRRGLVQVCDGSADLSSAVRRVGRWRFPITVRRTLRGSSDLLRFVPLGRRTRGQAVVLRPQALDAFGDDVTVVVLAPALLSTVATSPLLDWADAVLLTLVEGKTVTFDAEDAAQQVRTLSAAPAGVVLLDV